MKKQNNNKKFLESHMKNELEKRKKHLKLL